MSNKSNLAHKRDEYWAEVREDERAFGQLMYKVRTKKATFDPLIYNYNQNLIHERQLEVLKRGDPLRDAYLKYRQWGCSTLCLSQGATKTMAIRNWRTLITAQHKARAKQLFRTLRQFVGQVEGAVAPTIETDNAEELLLEDRNSSATVSTAKTPAYVRGDMINWWLLSEADYYLGEGGSLFVLLEGGLSMIPDEPGTGVVIETTANGTDGEYFPFFKQAMAGENGFRAIFVDWFNDWTCDKAFHLHDEDDELKNPAKYHGWDALRKDKHLVTNIWMRLRAIRAACPTCESRRQEFSRLYCDDDLRERQKKFRLTWEQVHWYWFYCNTKLHGDRLKMQQEFPCTWMEAFIASGTPVWDKNILQQLINRARPGEIFEAPLRSFTDLSQLLKGDGLVRGKDPYFEVWRKPLTNHRYCIGADSSTGSAKSNPSAAFVMDMETMGIVASVHGRIEGEEYGKLLARIGEYYNYAVVAPEKQQTGYLVLSTLEKIYNNVYIHSKLRPEGWKEMDTLGFSTDRETRPYMVQLARKMLVTYKSDLDALSDRIPCVELLQDMMLFTYGKMMKPAASLSKAAEDDRPMAWMICLAVTHQELGLGLNEDVTGKRLPKPEEEQAREDALHDPIQYFKELQRFLAGDHPMF